MKIRLALLLSFVAIISIAAHAQPAIQSIAPTSGPAGTTLTITGSGFNVSPVSISIEGVAGCKLTNLSDTMITCTMDTGTAGVRNVTVIAGGKASNSLPFTYTPVISGLSPTSTPANGGGTLTITGAGWATTAPKGTFNVPTAVLIGKAYCSLTGITATSITCAIPPGPSTGGAAAVAVVSNGVSSNQAVLNYTVATKKR